MPLCNSAWRMLCRSADLSVQCSRLWRVSIASLIPMFPDARASLVNIRPAALSKKPCNLIVARVSLILNYRSFIRVFLLPPFFLYLVKTIYWFLLFTSSFHLVSALWKRNSHSSFLFFQIFLLRTFALIFSYFTYPSTRPIKSVKYTSYTTKYIVFYKT